MYYSMCNKNLFTYLIIIVNYLFISFKNLLIFKYLEKSYHFWHKSKQLMFVQKLICMFAACVGFSLARTRWWHWHWAAVQKMKCSPTFSNLPTVYMVNVVFSSLTRLKMKLLSELCVVTNCKFVTPPDGL